MALAVLTVLVGAPLGAGAQSPQEANKKIVVEFYEKAINEKDFEAAAKFLGSRYTQHNPNAADVAIARLQNGQLMASRMDIGATDRSKGR
jgi:hypothetical protein